MGVDVQLIKVHYFNCHCKKSLFSPEWKLSRQNEWF